ncbi:MAG: TetR/AcrR family transcriptional regulator [Novosphingobium sp.]
MVAGARGKGRPKQAETAEIDLAIHRAALDVLLKQGAAATMNAVAEAAGLSRKSLYARYPNKTELFLDVIRGLLAGVSELAYDTRGTAEERLYNYVIAALEMISLPQSLAIQRLLTLDPAYIAALKTEMLGATHRIFFNPLDALLREAVASGELAIADITATTQAVIRLIFAESAAIDGRAASPDPALRIAYAAFLTQLMTRGILPRA